MQQLKPAYRPEIDGLRAIAVVPVILFHAGFTMFSGGFVGVDIFFVISGYLITSLIIKDLHQEKFSIIEFYERRARRIFPALFLVVAVSIVVSLIILFPADLKRFGLSVASVATFLSNIRFWQETGYFHPASEMKPLLHTWSLAVEEQFYLFFPPMLLLLWKQLRKWVMVILSSLLILSLAAAEYASGAAPGANFYLLPTRGWELLIGSVIAVYLDRSSPQWRPATREIAGGTGLLMIGISVIYFDALTPFPGLYALLPTVGTGLIILFVRQDGVFGSLLSNRLLVAVGLISYSAYLWHQPLFAFTRHITISEPTVPTFWALIAGTFALAYLSWRYVETPFRDRQKFTSRAIFLWSGIGLVTLLTVGLALYKSDGIPGRFSKEVNALAGISEPEGIFTGCNIREQDPDRLYARVQECYKPGRTLFLVGDSHARELEPALRKVAESKNLSLVALTSDSCFPITGADDGNMNAGCEVLTREVLAITAKFPAPVILSMRWRLNLSGTRFNNGEGGHEFGVPVDLKFRGVKSADPHAALAQELRDWSDVTPLILLTQIPEAGWDVPRKMARQVQFGADAGRPLSTSFLRYEEANARNLKMFDELAKSPNMTIVKAEDLVCDRTTLRCLNERDGAALYFDDDHPTAFFALQIAKKVAEAAISVKMDSHAISE